MADKVSALLLATVGKGQRGRVSFSHPWCHMADEGPVRSLTPMPSGQGHPQLERVSSIGLLKQGRGSTLPIAAADGVNGSSSKCSS